jgi:hypothetical protein
LAQMSSWESRWTCSPRAAMLWYRASRAVLPSKNIEREDAFSARLGRELVPAMWPGLPRDRFPLSGEKFGGQCGLRRPMGNDFLRCEEAELAELQRHIRSLDYGTQADEGADGGPGY